jgi:hypothetical protein
MVQDLFGKNHIKIVQDTLGTEGHVKIVHDTLGTKAM